MAGLQAANERGIDIAELSRNIKARSSDVEKYRQYCWPIKEIGDLKIAPFHVLATEGNAHFDKSHEWHMTQTAKLAHADGDLFIDTRRQTVDLTHDDSIRQATS